MTTYKVESKNIREEYTEVARNIRDIDAFISAANRDGYVVESITEEKDTDLSRFIGRNYELNFDGMKILATLVGDGSPVDLDAINLDAVANVPGSDFESVLFFRIAGGSELKGKYLGDGIVHVTWCCRTAVVNLED